MAVAIAFQASSFVTGNTSDPITFSGVATGTASSDRINVVNLHIDGRPTPTGMTINGVAATKAHAGANGNFRAEVWYAANPTGTTGDVVITFGDSTSAHVGIGMYAMTGAIATPSDTDTANSASANSISISALTIPSNGGAIIAMFCGGQTTAVTWSNATEGYDVNATGQRISGAHTTTAGTPTITADGANTEPYVLTGAAWSEDTGGAAGQPAIKRMAGVTHAQQVTRQFSVW